MESHHFEEVVGALLVGLEGSGDALLVGQVEPDGVGDAIGLAVDTAVLVPHSFPDFNYLCTSCCQESPGQINIPRQLPEVWGLCLGRSGVE